MPGIAAANELTGPSLVVQFGRPPNRIDLITGPDGLEFSSAWSRRVVTELPDEGGAIEVFVIGLAEGPGRPREPPAAAARPHLGVTPAAL